jgi:hypothetical protein
VSVSASTVNENDFATLSGSFTDPGTLDTHTVVINWGDGKSDTLILAGGVLSIPATAHQYLGNLPNDVPYTISVSITDKDNAVTSASTTVIVKNEPPAVITSLSSQQVQSGDPITTVTVTATDAPEDTLSITTQWSKNGSPFTNGLPDAGTIAGGLILGGTGGAGTGTWTLSGLADLAPGTYTIRFTVKDNDGKKASKDTVLDVKQEGALADYTGTVFASASSTTSSKATVTLSPTIRDISAVLGSAGYDPCLRDIRKAKVVFMHRDTNTLIASGVPVGLVNTGDLNAGTATYN